MKLRRRDLRKASRRDLERLASYYKLRFAPSWSQKHLAALVYWRITRDEKRNRH